MRAAPIVERSEKLRLGFGLGPECLSIPAMAALQGPGEREFRVLCQGHGIHEGIFVVTGVLQFVDVDVPPVRQGLAVEDQGLDLEERTLQEQLRLGTAHFWA